MNACPTCGALADADLDAAEANAQAAQLLETCAEKAVEITALVLALREIVDAHAAINAWTGRENPDAMAKRLCDAVNHGAEVLSGYKSEVRS